MSKMDDISSKLAVAGALRGDCGARGKYFDYFEVDAWTTR
jgi:hypothetical protein